MKINVLKTFRGKEENQVFKAGEIVEVSDARGKVILADKRKLAEKVKDEKPAEGSAEKKSTTRRKKVTK